MTEEVHGVSEEVKPNVLVSFLTYYVYMVLIVFGHIRDFFGSFFGRSRYLDQLPKKGIAPLLNSWENFFTRRLYHRIQDCWNRPIASAPGTHIKVMERVSDDGNKTLRTTGKVIDCINLGSYNYLGFADDWQEVCGEDVLGALEVCHFTPVRVSCFLFLSFFLSPGLSHLQLLRSHQQRNYVHPSRARTNRRSVP